ncbi:hypothetical protein HOY80DRAFT_975373 [Tuber brumale]|nr:hypothetical protein HOY80DRAFT_975373 [Tuber brumale]
MGGQNRRAEWDKEMEQVLINALVLQARLGKRTESDFKKEAWKEGVRSTLNCHFSQALTVAQVKNKITMLKWKFVIF